MILEGVVGPQTETMKWDWINKNQTKRTMKWIVLIKKWRCLKIVLDFGFKNLDTLLLSGLHEDSF